MTGSRQSADVIDGSGAIGLSKPAARNAKSNAKAAARDAVQRPRRISLYNYAASFVAFDAAAIVLAGVAMGALLHLNGLLERILSDAQMGAIFFACCLFPFIAQSFGVYRVDAILNAPRAKSRVALSLFFTFAFIVMLAAAAKSAELYSRLWFFGWFLACVAAMVVMRIVVIAQARRALKSNAYVYKALSCGVGCDAISQTEIARKSNDEVFVLSSQRVEKIGDLASISDAIANDEIDQVYLSAPWDAIPALLRNLDLLRHLSTEVLVLPGDRRMHAEVSRVGFFGDRLSFRAIEQPLYGWGLWLKRAEDLTVSLSALALLSPLLALVAIAIKLDSPGPVIFYQMRTGFNGRIFRLRKFRSMYADQTDHDATRQTSKGDARVTRIGRVIRRLSIDELPQLLNVLDGTMSIVGPRPHALATKTHGQNLEELVDYYAVRHRVKPGLTGWAQIHGFRGELDSLEKLQKRVDYDIDYINNWTPWLDMKVMAKTVFIILRDKSAY